MNMSGSLWRNIFPSSGRDDRRLLDDVEHEPARVPIGRGGLRLAARARASHHQHLRSPAWHDEAGLPLAEAVFAFILAEFGLLPGLAAVAGEVNARDAAIAAKSNAARKRRGA
jgi:hypothetical protein